MSNAARVSWPRALEGAPSPAAEGRFWGWLADVLEPGAACPRRSPEVELRGFSGRRRGPSYVLKNGSVGTYLRLTAEEHFVWQRLDGRPLRQIVADYLAEYDALAPGVVVGLVERLRAAAMLAEGPRPLYAALGQQLARRSWGWRAEQLLKGALFFERPLPGAGPLARGLYRAGGRFLFNRPAAIILALVALAGLVAFLSLASRGGFELITSGGSFARGFVMFALANALASLMAEVGRALATVHHGRAVRAGGLRMMLAVPTFYADTRDIWLEDRRARLSVAAAGPAALFTSAGGAALALLAAPDGPLADFLFKFSLLCYGTAIFYLNPLVELDGYALLSEWLEQPELRRRSLEFVRGGLLGKLRAHRTLDRSEQGLAVFGVLAVVWGAYTAGGGVLFFGRMIVAGLDELWRDEQVAIRVAAMLGTVLAGAALALVAALAVVRAVSQLVRWAERQGFLADAGRLSSIVSGVALLLGGAALLAPIESATSRALLVPALLMVAVLYAFRLARDYDGARLRWFFTILGLYAALLFVKEDVAAVQAVLGLEVPWPGRLDRAVSLAGPLVCLPFGFWLASLATSRYRAPLGLLAAGLALNALQTVAPPGRPVAALATAATALLAGGLLGYSLLGRRWTALRPLEAPPAADDAARLAEAFRTVLASLLDDLVAQSGRRAADSLQRRFNEAAARAGWSLTLRDLRAADASAHGDLLTAAPRYRQALDLLLAETTVRAGRAFVERALARARDALPWDRREVFEAWVLAELSWGQAARRRSSAEQADRLRFLRRVPLFAGLDETELRGVAEALGTRRVPAGRSVVRQGESGDTFYLIQTGLADVIKREAGRTSYVVARLGEADGFGELALLRDQPRNATVRAVTRLELLTLGRADFDRLVRERFALVGKLGAGLDREPLLAAIPLFAHLAPAELGALARRLEELDLPAGQAVVRQGEAGDRFYLVRAGLLAVLVEDTAGERREVARLGPGEYFGEMALLHAQPRTATVTSLAPTRLFALRKADFDRLLWGHHGAGRDLELVASRRRLDLAAKARAQ